MSGQNAGAADDGSKGRRSKKRTVALVVASLLAMVTIAGGAIYWDLNGNLSTFGLDGLSSDRPSAAGPDASGHSPVNVLLIGSDSRGGANRDFGGGQEGGARSDTAILLHVYADHRHAVGVSLPRDALVTIPKCRMPNGKWTGEQTNAMFNSAFSVGNTEEGNPACTQNTVERLTKLRVDHTIVVDFHGFASMTSAIGGVDVCLPKAIYEGDLNPNLGYPGRRLFTRGTQSVSGQQALDYVRLRHGVGDGSDIGRMKRQQAFLSSLFKSAKSKGMNPTVLLPLADAATKSLLVDEGLGSAAKLMSFALSLKNVDLHDIKFVTAPWRFLGARVALVQPDADQLWATLRADRTLDGQDASGGRATATAEISSSPTPIADPEAGDESPTGDPSSPATVTATPGLLPSSIGETPRSAADDPCANISYG